MLSSFIIVEAKNYILSVSISPYFHILSIKNISNEKSLANNNNNNKALDQFFHYSNYLKLIENYQKMSNNGLAAAAAQLGLANLAKMNSNNNSPSQFSLSQNLLSNANNISSDSNRSNNGGNDLLNTLDNIALSTFTNAAL